MAIKYTEESALGPVIALLGWRLHYVQDYGDSVLIIISDDALIGVSRIAGNDAILSHRALGLLEVGQLHSVRVWVRGISEEQSIDICHTWWLRGLG